MTPSRTSNSPSLRLRTPRHTARLLRRHFRRHNRRVLLLTVATAFVTLLAWLLVYVACTWLLVLAVAVLELPTTRIPQGFAILFIVGAACAVAYAWIDRKFTPNERPHDEKRPLELVSEILLAIPRMTLAIGGTLSAWQRLSDADLAQAASILHRLAEKKRLPLSAVRLEIPDADAAVRILFALQITEIIESHRDEAEFYLKLSALRPPELKLRGEAYADA